MYLCVAPCKFRMTKQSNERHDKNTNSGTYPDYGNSSTSGIICYFKIDTNVNVFRHFLPRYWGV
jgi:hypothetical protein